MIKTGRNGQVKYDQAGTTPEALINLNHWKLDRKTPKSKVTCFGAVNEVYVPGLPDISGSLDGFWDSTALELFQAAEAGTPGLLELIPNTDEAAFKWSGLAYLDASIDCKLDGAPSVSGSFVAGGPWTFATEP